MNEEDKIIFQRLIYYNDEEHLAKRIIELQHYNKDLQQELQRKDNNWNELKEFLENNYKETQDIWYVKIINKMKELENEN